MKNKLILIGICILLIFISGCNKKEESFVDLSEYCKTEGISFGDKCNEYWVLELNEKVKLDRFEEKFKDVVNYKEQDDGKLICKKTNEDESICEPKMIDYNVNYTLSEVTYLGTTVDCCLVEDTKNFEKIPQNYPKNLPKCRLTINKDMNYRCPLTENVCKMGCYI